MATLPMITYPCPSCRRPLEVDDDLANQQAACPHCGAVNTVPQRSARPDGVPVARPARPVRGDVAGIESDRAAAKGLPPDSGPEQLVLKVHPAMFRARPFWGMLISILVVGGLAGAVALVMREQKAWAWTSFGAAGLGVFWWCVWKVRTMTDTLTITNKRTTQRSGLLARSTREVLHDRVQDIQVTQSFPQRMLGVGSIGISSAGQADVEIVIGDLPNPIRIRETIDAYREIG